MAERLKATGSKPDGGKTPAGSNPANSTNRERSGTAAYMLTMVAKTLQVDNIVYVNAGDKDFCGTCGTEGQWEYHKLWCWVCSKYIVER